MCPRKYTDTLCQMFYLLYILASKILCKYNENLFPQEGIVWFRLVYTPVIGWPRMVNSLGCTLAWAKEYLGLILAGVNWACYSESYDLFGTLAPYCVAMVKIWNMFNASSSIFDCLYICFVWPD